MTLPLDTPPGRQSAGEIEVVPYDPAWPHLFEQERERILAQTGTAFGQLEHIGSTAVAGLWAKPIIDMMAAVADLGQAPTTTLLTLGYEVIETGMRDRVFLRHYPPADTPRFHLHIVEQSTWATRKERLMRDYLRRDPDAALAYGHLKAELVAQYKQDSEGYTRAKTDFIQDIINRARSELGLPGIDVWNDE